MNDELKECRVCKDSKPPRDFSPDRRICRTCVSRINSQRLRANPVKNKAFKKYRKKWEFVNQEERHKYHLEWRRSNTERLLLYHARRRAKKHNIECDLILEDIIVPEVCPVFGIPIKTDSSRFSDNSPSLDRLVPSEGYTKKNTRVISNRANMIKNCGTVKEHEMIVSYMKENGC